MRANLKVKLPALALAVLMAAPGMALSQTGTPEADAPAPPPEALRRVPGITVLPPVDGPATDRLSPGRGQSGDSQQQPEGGPGCQFRDNRLELIV